MAITRIEYELYPETLLSVSSKMAVNSITIRAFIIGRKLGRGWQVSQSCPHRVPPTAARPCTFRDPSLQSLDTPVRGFVLHGLIDAQQQTHDLGQDGLCSVTRETQDN